MAGQRVQSGPSRSFLDPNGHTRSSAGGESHVPNGAGGEPWGVQNGGFSKKTGNDSSSPRPIVRYGCGEPGHIRPNCPHNVKRVRSPTLGCSHNIVNSFVSGFVNDTHCDKLFIDSGCEVTCVA